ncbi:MAG: STAS domain-containing protein [Neptuniibacter sp.]
MTAKALLTSDGIIQLSGELKFPVVVQLRKELESLLESVSDSVQIDFSGVVASDSSALSLWMCCLRYVEPLGTKIVPVNVPEEMVHFAEVVGLDKHLGQ